MSRDEPLSPDASRFAELWYRRYMRTLENLQAWLRRLEALEPTPSRPGRPLGPRAFRSLDEFDALLRQVMLWLEKAHATTPKWRIVNAMYHLSKQPRPQRHDQFREMPRADRLS